MNQQIIKTLYWLPRIITILFIIFISMFGLDVFGEYNFPLVLVALLIHLIPSFILIIILLISWKNEMLGGAIFYIAATAALIFFNAQQHFFTILFIIVLPITLVGTLFVISGYLKKISKFKLINSN